MTHLVRHHLVAVGHSQLTSSLCMGARVLEAKTIRNDRSVDNGEERMLLLLSNEEACYCRLVIERVDPNKDSLIYAKVIYLGPMLGACPSMFGHRHACKASERKSARHIRLS